MSSLCREDESHQFLRPPAAPRLCLRRLGFVRQLRDPHRQRQLRVRCVAGLDPVFGCVSPRIELAEAVDIAEYLLISGVGFFGDGRGHIPGKGVVIAGDPIPSLVSRPLDIQRASQH